MIKFGNYLGDDVATGRHEPGPRIEIARHHNPQRRISEGQPA